MRAKHAILGMLTTLSALLTVPCQGAENTVQKDIVWSQQSDDGLRQEIYASAYQAGAWTERVKITEGNNNLHPALAVAPDGSRWAFWSAVNPDGISIEYAIGKNGTWLAPSKLELEDLNSAITPSVLIDKSGTVWLVWAGNDGGQDEIYCSRYTESSSWQKPELVNKANTVPDIKPKIVLNEQGVIEVRWEGVRNGKYVPLLSSYTGGHWSPEQQVEQKQAEETKPELPTFIPENSQYSLQVP